MRRLALFLTLLLVAPFPLRAGTPPTRTEVLLLECPTISALRARLERYADSSAAGDAFGSGEACTALGASFARDGQPDSAIAWYARAVERRGDTEEILALADLLLERRHGDDMTRATTLLQATLAGTPAPEAQVPYRARLAWALHLSGRPDSAATQFAAIEKPLEPSLEWCERMGLATFAARRYGAALRWLSVVALASRGQASGVMDTLGLAIGAFPGGGPKPDAQALIAGQIAARDRPEDAWLGAMAARRVAFTASDGFPLGGIAIAPEAGPPRPGAVVMADLTEAPASCDSLAVALARANLAVILLDRRGSRRSVAPSCPLPHYWRGRERALEERCARDARDAIRALAGVTPLDTTSYVVVGVGAAAATAVQAATLDARIRALLLVSPSPHPVDRGVMRARIAALQRPVFFQIAPEDFALFDLTDAFYQAGDQPRSRVSNARGAGRGAAQFRGDPAVAERLRRWLAESLAAPRRPAPPPSRRRR